MQYRLPRGQPLLPGGRSEVQRAYQAPKTAKKSTKDEKTYRGAYQGCLASQGLTRPMGE